MRSAIPAASIALVAAVAGCGAETPHRARVADPVQLRITVPADGGTVHDADAEVRGRVSPSTATVAVLGRPALVTAGRFSVVVPLEPGANVIDVIATAPRRSTALTALRVTRDVFVAVPDLAGVPEDEIQGRLDPLDLDAEITRGGGLLDLLRSGDRTVCEQQPRAGARLRRGSTVDVVVAKRC